MAVSPNSLNSNSRRRAFLFVVNAMTRILVADAHEVVRWGLQRVLHARPDFEVVAEATDGKQPILNAILAKPYVAVTEYSLPPINGLEVTRRLRRRLPRTEILIF